MKNAKILVYEDIVVDPGETQYIKKTLDTMGLNYKWDGNAVGRLKSDLLAGAPGGTPWDLVILGIEARGNVSGEYFEYLMDVINQGTARYPGSLAPGRHLPRHGEHRSWPAAA